MGSMKMLRMEEPFTLSNHHAYARYVRYKKKFPKKSYVTDKKHLRTITNAIFAKIKEGIVENEAGVVMKGLGYFCIFRSVNKSVAIIQKENGETDTAFCIKKGGKKVWPMFYPTRVAKYLVPWSMDTTFHHTIKTKVEYNAQNGITYKMYPYTLRITKAY